MKFLAFLFSCACTLGQGSTSDYLSEVEIDLPVLIIRGGGNQASLPNGEPAYLFDGTSHFIEIADAPYLSIASTGALTIEAWMRPDVLEFPDTEGSGYVNWLGKGKAGQHEYTLRMYSLTNLENRPSRISGYAFNLTGSYGSGSYFQDQVAPGEWIYVAVVFNTVPSFQYPTGYVKIFKNGVLRDTTALNQFNVTPDDGTAPLRIGTRDFNSYFKGAIGNVALYSTELTAERVQAHYAAMLSP